MFRAKFVVLSAATIVAALGLSGCGSAPEPAAPSPAPLTTAAAAPPVAPPAAPTPPPEALTDVLYRLADVNLPGAQKVGLVQFATPDDAAALDKFGRALLDGGFRPPTFAASDLVWSQSAPGNVVASVTVSSEHAAAHEFTFPLEFNPHQGGWQLTQDSADLLLEMGPSAPPTR